MHWATCCFIESCNVIFDEGEAKYQQIILQTYNNSNITPTSTTTPNTLPPVNSTTAPAAPPITPASPSLAPEDPSLASEASLGPQHATCMPVRNDDDRYSVTHKHADEHAHVATAGTAGNLCTYAEAMACPDAAQWELACTSELRAFGIMGVYKVVPIQETANLKVIGSKWVFRIKCGPDRSIQK